MLLMLMLMLISGSPEHEMADLGVLNSFFVEFEVRLLQFESNSNFVYDFDLFFQYRVSWVILLTATLETMQTRIGDSLLEQDGCSKLQTRDLYLKVLCRCRKMRSLMWWTGSLTTGNHREKCKISTTLLKCLEVRKIGLLLTLPYSVKFTGVMTVCKCGKDYSYGTPPDAVDSLSGPEYKVGVLVSTRLKPQKRCKTAKYSGAPCQTNVELKEACKIYFKL